MAREMGDVRMANSIVLGAMSNGLDLSLDSWTQAVKTSV